MKTYKFIIFSIAFTLGLIGTKPASAQWVNNGADVFIAPTAQVIVNNADYVQQSGDVELQGWLGVGGNWENNDNATNALNQNGVGTVEFLGVDQSIGGSNQTKFYNLLLSGTGIKTLDIDQEVTNTLDLTDRELALQISNISITNTDVNAITRSSGFISSASMQASIIRNTALAGDYLFPTGSTLGLTPRYRPVILTVPAASATLAVAFSNSDPNVNGLTRGNLSQGLTDINPNFYHRIERVEGTTPFDISILYNDADGGFKEMAYWDNANSWKNLNKTTLIPGDYGDNLTSKITKSSVDLLGIKYFALANGTAGPNFLSIPTAFSPNGDGMNDLFLIGGLDSYPDNEVRILNRWGDELYYKKSYNSSNAFDGAGFDPGTYYYVVKVNLNGQAKLFSGYITLLR